MPAVNQSTIYRSLDRLAQSGQISVSDIGTGAAVYEIVADHLHHHLICSNCAKMLTIGHEAVDCFFGEIQDKQEFKVHTNHLVIFGVCEDCRKIKSN